MFGNDGEQLLGKTQRILLELSTVFYFIAKNSAIPLVQQYVYYLVAKKYNFTSYIEAVRSPLDGGNETSGGGWEAGNNVTASPEDKEAVMYVAHRVNEESSLIILYLNVAELFPAAIMVLFLGFYSDMTGRRKFLMWLPCLGNAIYALGFVLPLYICGGDIDHPATKAMFVVASLCSGLSGTVPGFLSGNASYISDTDSPRRRTLRLAIVEMSIGLTFGITNLFNGIWIDATDHFEQPLWFVVFFSLLPFLILVFFLKEPNGEISSQLGQPTTFRDFRGIKHVFGCKTIPQRRLWALFFAFQVYVFVQQGQERTQVLFLQNYPLYWSPTEIGVFLFVLYTLSGLGSYPGVPLLKRICDDVAIATIAMISKALGSFLLAFAQEDFTVYIASVVQLFHLTPYAVSRSLVSQQVGEDEQGSVYAMMHSVQSVVGFLGPLFHNAIFAGSLRFMSGLVFLVSGPLLIIPIVLLAYVKYLDKQEEGYMSMEGANAPNALTPGSMTPLSETAGFAHQSDDFASPQGTQSDRQYN